MGTQVAVIVESGIEIAQVPIPVGNARNGRQRLLGGLFIRFAYGGIPYLELLGAFQFVERDRNRFSADQPRMAAVQHP
ncbi:hypothetical protein D3C72_2193240 [compost metagenome]